MSIESDAAEPIIRDVLAFDICSSTDILEDLLRTGSAKRWRDLHIHLKRWLRGRTGTGGFQLYQFTGDGWILLFPPLMSGRHLMDFLKGLCLEYQRLYNELIKPVIETTPEVVGVTFGMDRGQLIKVRMNNKDEYIGRPINVACRLQSAIKDRDKRPEYKVLMSKHFYETIKTDIQGYNFWEVKRELRYIAGGREICCMKAIILRTDGNVQKWAAPRSK